MGRQHSQMPSPKEGAREESPIVGDPASLIVRLALHACDILREAGSVRRIDRRWLSLSLTIRSERHLPM